jgi:hypothetical protein
MLAMMALVASLAAAPAGQPAPFSEGDLVGSWNVKMRADYSTCSEVKVGDERAEVWTLSRSGSRIDVRVAASPGSTQEYTGGVRKDGVVELRAGPAIGIELRPHAAGELVGRRLVAANDTRRTPSGQLITDGQLCVISYEIALKRQF